jgi:hypothetical protein
MGEGQNFAQFPVINFVEAEYGAHDSRILLGPLRTEDFP